MEQAQYVALLEIINRLGTKLDKVIASSVASSPENAYRSPEVKDLFSALAKAQGEMQAASMNKENPYFKSRYADFAEIVRASRPALTKNGLAVMQEIKITEDGQSVLHTLLTHASGQWIESRMRIIPPKNDIQSISSYVTYLKRLCYASLIGVAVGEEDDDGEIAMANARQIVAKGPSNTYNPKEQSLDTVTKEQIEELEYELADHPDLAEEIMDKLRLQSLADMPKTKYHVSLQRIREIKGIRNGTIKPKE
jgi:hypothetical protein